MDSPILAGNPAIYTFTVQGIPHFIVNVGEGGIWDGQKTVDDVRKIVETVAGFWGTVPYEKYVFFNLITEANGGLEHKNACTLMTSRWKARTRRGYVDWLTLVSHEFFHAWNVKRLRPAELGPFDYDRENPTRSLWVAEGITSYYGDLLAARAGVITRDEYLERAGQSDRRTAVHAGPLVDAGGRRVVRRLDQLLPSGREFAQRLDQLLHERRGGRIPARPRDPAHHERRQVARRRDAAGVATVFRPARFHAGRIPRARVSKWPASDLSARGCTRRWASTDELDYSNVSWLGLRIRNDSPPTPRAWLGLTLTGATPTLKNDGGRLVVAQVRRGSPAYDAGVNVDDEILAIDDYRVRPEGWEARLDAYRPGDRVRLLVARREHITPIDVAFAPEPARVTRIEPDSAGRRCQRANGSRHG